MNFGCYFVFQEEEDLKQGDDHDHGHEEEEEWFEDELVSNPAEDETLKQEAAKLKEERMRIENEVREAPF
jgi:hypothetical protein